MEQKSFGEKPTWTLRTLIVFVAGKTPNQRKTITMLQYSVMDNNYNGLSKPLLGLGSVHYKRLGKKRANYADYGISSLVRKNMRTFPFLSFIWELGLIAKIWNLHGGVYMRIYTRIFYRLKKSSFLFHLILVSPHDT